MANSPRIRALNARIEQVRAGHAERALWPNPSVTFARESVFSTDDTFLLARQELPISGRRSQLRTAGRIAVEAAQAEARFQMMQLQADLREAYTALLLAQEREAVLRSGIDALQRLVDVLRVREEGGEGSSYDRIRGARAVLDLEADLSAAAAARAQAQGQLAAYLGSQAVPETLVAADALSPATTVPSLATVVQEALSSRGDYQSTQLSIGQFDAEREAATRLRVPTPTFTGGLKRSDTGNTSASGYQFSVDIAVPLFSRGQAAVALASAQKAQAEAEAESWRMRIEAEVRAAHTALRIHQERAARYRQSAAEIAEPLARSAGWPTRKASWAFSSSSIPTARPLMRVYESSISRLLPEEPRSNWTGRSDGSSDHEDAGHIRRDAGARRPPLGVPQRPDARTGHRGGSALGGRDDLDGEDGALHGVPAARRWRGGVVSYSPHRPLHIRTVARGQGRGAIRGRDHRALRSRWALDAGIFNVTFKVPATRRYQVAVELHSAGLSDELRVGAVTVHSDQQSALAAIPADEEGATSFLKEQQWTLDFATMKVESQARRQVVSVPATIEPRVGGSAEVRAPTAGRIATGGGRAAGSPSIAATALAELIVRNERLGEAPVLKLELAQAEAALRLAQEDLARIERLVGVGAVPQRRLAEARAAHETAAARVRIAEEQSRHLELSRTGQGTGEAGERVVVRAPITGVVAESSVTSGATVEEGQLLYRIVALDRVHVVGAVRNSIWPESQTPPPRRSTFPVFRRH
jgi:outer membrane protein TolC